MECLAAACPCEHIPAVSVPRVVRRVRSSGPNFPWPMKMQTRARDGQRAYAEANAAQAAFAVWLMVWLHLRYASRVIWLSVVGEIDVAILNTCYGW